MQQVIEAILKSEEDCAKRLDEQRKAMDSRRAEIEAEHAQAVEVFRRQAQDRSAEKIAFYRQRLRKESADAVARSRESAEHGLMVNQVLIDRIVERIVRLITGNT